MSLAILKSPTLNSQPRSLRGDCVPPVIEVKAVDPRLAIEAKVRAELNAEFDAKLDAIKDEAYAEGYKEGLTSGHQEGHATALDAFKKKQGLLEQVLQKAEGEIEAWLQSSCDQALDIAKEALCHFVGQEAINPAVLQEIIKRVTAKLRDADVLSIRLYPSDCSALRQALRHSVSTLNHVGVADKLIEDSSLTAGGIVVATPRGEYRATLDVQLKKMLSLIEAQRREQPLSTAVCHAIRA